MRGGTIFRNCLGAIALLGVVSAGAACTPTIDSRGHVPDKRAIDQIQPGEQTRAEVSQLLGSPSSVGTFDEHRWYYISSRTETLAFYKPEMIDQQVLVIEFDQCGVVKSVHQLTEADAREIEPVDRVTPTYGKELGFFEQIFGNIGRFSKGKPGQQPTQPGPGSLAP